MNCIACFSSIVDIVNGERLANMDVNEESWTRMYWIIMMSWV